MPGRRILAALVLTGGCIFGLAEDGSRPSYHADVAEVRLTFFATDQNQRAVNLSEKDFAVVDRDLVVRNFSSFGPAASAGLGVAVILDSSQSVANLLRNELASTLELIGQSAGVPQTSLSLISFRGAKPTLICSDNCSTSAAAFHLAEAGGLTPLFDSIVYASSVIAARASAHTKKVLVIFSDGEDTISQHAAADALQAVLSGDIQIYAVNLNAPGGSPRGTSTLQKLARATGGRYFVSQNAGQVFDALVRDVHAEYTVTYRMPERAAGFHHVRILPTRNLNLRFHCRGGYQYSTGSQ